MVGIALLQFGSPIFIKSSTAPLLDWPGFNFINCFAPYAIQFTPYAQLLRSISAAQKLGVGRERLAWGTEQFMKLNPWAIIQVHCGNQMPYQMYQIIHHWTRTTKAQIFRIVNTENVPFLNGIREFSFWMVWILDDHEYLRPFYVNIFK